LLTTLKAGLLISNPTGDIVKVLNDQNGLYDNTVLGSYVDSQGDVWLGLNTGIARISTNALVSSFDKSTGLPGSVSKIIRHKGQIHVATFQGLYRLMPSGNEKPATFVPIENINTTCWSLASVRDILLAGCGNQLLDVYNNRIVLELPDTRTVYYIKQARTNPDRIYLGLHSGFMIIEYKNGTWHSSIKLDIESPIRSIVEDNRGNVWLGSEQLGPISISPPFRSGELDIRKFTEQDGLPPSGGEVIKVADQIFFRSYIGHGVFASKQLGDSLWFEPQSTIEMPDNGSKIPIQSLLEYHNSDIHVSASIESKIGKRQSDSSYIFVPSPLRVAEINHTFEILIEEDGVSWFGHDSGIIRVEESEWGKDQAPYKASIRRISAGDSLLFGGIQREAEAAHLWPLGLEKIRFEFAAPRYESTRNNQYRTWLKGYNASWSTWGNESWVDYTNLHEGDYTFLVQAKDLQGQLSQEAMFSFRIPPPWYRTLWAYGGLVLLFGAIVTGITTGYSRIQSRKMRARNEELEELVQERTALLSAAIEEARVINDNLIKTNATLEDRTDQLRDALERNKEILGITAHDLKNPLGGIIGLAEMMLEDMEDGIQATYNSAIDNIPLLKDEAERMLKIIKSLLDKQRQGEAVILNKETVLLSDIVSAVVRWNTKQATDKEMQIHFHADETIILTIDVLAIQRVLDNYVSNAIKYSPAGSNIWISMYQCHSSQKRRSPYVRVAVKDEGPGLSDEDKQKVFGKMQRLSAKPTGGEHSTGLGLFIVKQLVEAHEGTVGVDSTQGEGATFWYTLPILTPHLNTHAPV